MIGLYFAQGLPYGFFVQAVPVFLRKENLSLSVIGASYLLLLPWALKFLWAPLSDSQTHSKFGRRKFWILTNQIISVLLLALLSFMPLEAAALAWLAAAFLLVNFLAASQDALSLFSITLRVFDDRLHTHTSNEKGPIVTHSPN